MLEITIVEIRDEYDIVVARMEAKEEARKIGFGIVDQTRIATAVSELATSLSMEEVRIQINVIRAANAAAAVWRREDAIDAGERERDATERDAAERDARANEGMRIGIEIIASDSGPGIEDIEKALEDGYSSGGGLGIGLGGIKRLMDEFEIWSKVGEGTKVRVVKWMKT